MKTILLTIIVIISVYSMHSQDSEPTAWTFTLDGNVGPFNPSNYQQSNILTGFQWSGTLEMNNILMNNCMAGSRYNMIEENARQIPLMLVLQPTYRSETSYHVAARNAPFMRYEPSLPLTEFNKGTVMRTADPQNPIFGFIYRRGTISQDSSDPDYSRLKLYRDSTDTYGDTVLRNIWPQPHFITKEFDKFENGGQTDNYLGRKWYLKINLKRLNTINNNASDDSVVLIISMPRYDINKNSLGNMRFDSIPSAIKNDMMQMNFFENRGYIQNLKQDTTLPNEIRITRNMLPDSAMNFSSITIPAAFFSYDNPLPNRHYSFGTKNMQIDSFDIQVKYNGNLDIWIDWISIESINAHYLLMGCVDSLAKINDGRDGRGFITLYTDPIDDNLPLIDRHFEQPNNTYNIIQSCYDSLAVKTRSWTDAKLLRFYYQDTESDKFYWWGPLRYCNMLSNGMFLTRDNHQYPAIYRHYTKTQNRWIGVLFNDYDRLTPAPYCRNGNEYIQSMGIKWGFVGSHSQTHFPDTLNSDYETHIESMDSVKILRYYFDSLFFTPEPVQVSWERYLYNNFYNTSKKNQELIYSGQSWWMYALLYSVGKVEVNNKDNIFFSPYRPKTAEELRLQLNSCLIRGAKGFILDGDSQDTLVNVGAGQMRIVNHPLLPYVQNFWSDSLGPDFYMYDYDIWVAKNYMDTASIASTMRIPPHRIYLGPKSIRTELYRFNRFIREHDSLLMRLRLSASLMKGYRVWYNQDVNQFGTANIFNKYLLYDELQIIFGSTGIKTRPVGRSLNLNPHYEPWDSSFVDISLFRDSSDSQMTSKVFYVAVHNKRTSPLIFNDGEVEFYSSAEFDENIVKGGRSINGILRPASWWQEKWWKRQGAREVNVKLNLGSQYNNKLLRVTEIGLSHDSLKLIHTFDGDTLTDAVLSQLYPRFNKIIGINGHIVTNYLPGEAKLFKCEIIDEDDDLRGDLANSNQCKMVAYPVLDSNGNETSAIQYHIVYFKADTNDNDRVKVYYSRSMPLDSISTLEELDPVNYSGDDRFPQNIIWQRFENNDKSFIISDNFLDLNLQQMNSDECDYPSIVVRKDTNDNKLKAYIIYTCKGDATNSNARVIVSALDVSNPQSNPDRLSNRQIDLIQTPADSLNQTYSNRSQWGTPVVNASSNGIYYAWSSGGGVNPPSNSYIRAAFAPADSGIPSSYVTILDPVFFSCPTYTATTHKFPSVNTYSVIKLGEEHCSLVWSGKLNGPYYGQNYQLLYTNLKLDTNGNIFCTIPQNIEASASKFILRNSLNNVVMIANGGNNSYPVIGRYSIYFSWANCILRFERIMSQLDDRQVIKNSSIFSLASLFRDDGSNLTGWYYGNIIFLTSPFSNYTQSSISQQSGYYLKAGIETRNSNLFVMNYNSDGEIIQRLDFNPTNKYSFLDYTKYSRYLFPGTQSHLSQYPELNYNHVWRNRRIFNDDDKILANAKYFFNLFPENLEEEMFIGFSCDTGSIFIGDVTIDNQGLTFNLPVDSMVLQGYSAYYCTTNDTLVSDWFSLTSNSYLRFKNYGLDSTAHLYLQYSDDSSLVPLTLPITCKEDSCYIVNYNLIDGDIYNFRLILIGGDTNKVFKRHIIIDGIPTIDTMDYVVYLNKPIIMSVPTDKQSQQEIALDVTPNPAQNVVYITARMPEAILPSKEEKDIVIKLISLEGNELYSYTGMSGVTKSISMEKYAQGVYFIRAEANDIMLFEKVLPALRQIIIKK